MRTAPKLLLCTCAVVGLSAGIGTGVAVYLQPEPVLLTCPDVPAIPEVREIQIAALPPAWPIPPEAAPLIAPRRAVQRKRAQSLIAAPPVEQCTPGPLSGVPRDDAALREVPEPGSAALAGLGLAALVIARARRPSPAASPI